MIVVKYKSGTNQSQIESVIFKFVDDTKSFKMVAEEVYDETNPEQITGQVLRLAIRDSDFGDEELYVSFNVEDGRDLVRNMQRMLRQVGSFVPPDPEEPGGGEE